MSLAMLVSVKVYSTFVKVAFFLIPFFLCYCFYSPVFFNLPKSSNQEGSNEWDHPNNLFVQFASFFIQVIGLVYPSCHIKIQKNVDYSKDDEFDHLSLCF